MLINPKVGDKIVCIDNYDIHGERTIPTNLIYVITEVRFDGLIVTSNNEKSYGPYYSYRFKTLKEVRKEKLTNIKNAT